MPVVPPVVLALAAGAAQHALARRDRPGLGRRIGAGAVAAASLGVIGATSSPS